MAKNVFRGIGFVGLGAVGRSLARAFHQAGVPVTGVINRDPDAGRQFAAELQIEKAAVAFSALDERTEILIIAVPDDTLQEVARDLAGKANLSYLRACAHTSGVHPGKILTAIANAGVPVGSLHPLQTFPSPQRFVDPAGTFFAVEGDPQAVALLVNLVHLIGGIPVEISAGGKTLYHAAAVLASNSIPVLLKSAVQLLQSMEIPEEKARDMLAPLMRTSLENCFQMGTEQALTGPVARGDVETVRRELDELRERFPDAFRLYRIVTGIALDMANGKRTDAERLRLIGELLK